jgi:hypothetical protein
MPQSWITDENVRFNGSTDRAVVLSVTNGTKALILWDKLATEDQNTLTNLINTYGGQAPLTGPTSGYQVLDFKGLVTGGASTGLSSVATATAGYATINLGGTATLTTASRLTATVNVKSGVARTYKALAIIDGKIIKSISVSGSVGTTIGNVITAINTSLGATATASLVNGNIKITSATTGTLSSVVIQDTGFLFNSLTGYVGITSIQGLAPVTYAMNVNVNGSTILVSFTGNDAQTYTTLISAINADLGTNASAAIVNGDIKITSATTGLTSKILVTDNNLLKSLTVFKSSKQPVNGIVNLLDMMKVTRSLNGSLYSEDFKIINVGSKPVVPPFMLHSTSSTYYDGTHWKYLDTDVNV